MSKSVIPVDTTVAPKVKNNRKTQRDEVQATWRIGRPNENDTSRFVKMAPRSVRRDAQLVNCKPVGKRRTGKNFRAVYNHAIPVKESHDSIMYAMRIMNRRQAMIWAPKLECALNLVLWGLSVKGFVQNYETVNRHNAMKAAGTWVERAIS